MKDKRFAHNVRHNFLSRGAKASGFLGLEEKLAPCQITQRASG